MIKQSEQGRMIATWAAEQSAGADFHQVMMLAAANIAQEPFHSLTLLLRDVLLSGNDYRGDDERFRLAMDWLEQWCNTNGMAVLYFGTCEHCWAIVLRPDKVAADRSAGTLTTMIVSALTDAFVVPGSE
jgi:hypothetical protein